MLSIKKHNIQEAGLHSSLPGNLHFATELTMQLCATDLSP